MATLRADGSPRISGTEVDLTDDGEVEPVAHPAGLVGVAAEADRLTALLVEPAHLIGRGQRTARVDLEGTPRGGERAEHRAVLLLEVLLYELVRPAGPVPPREV